MHNTTNPIAMVVRLVRVLIEGFLRETVGKT